MQSKFDKYWAEMGDLYCIASMMDPRYKMALLTHILKNKMHLSRIEAEDKLDFIKRRWINSVKILLPVIRLGVKNR